MGCKLLFNRSREPARPLGPAELTSWGTVPPHTPARQVLTNHPLGGQGEAGSGRRPETLSVLGPPSPALKSRQGADR